MFNITQAIVQAVDTQLETESNDVAWITISNNENYDNLSPTYQKSVPFQGGNGGGRRSLTAVQTDFIIAGIFWSLITVISCIGIVLVVYVGSKYCCRRNLYPSSQYDAQSRYDIHSSKTVASDCRSVKPYSKFDAPYSITRQAPVMSTVWSRSRAPEINEENINANACYINDIDTSEKSVLFMESSEHVDGFLEEHKSEITKNPSETAYTVNASELKNFSVTRID